MVSCGSSVKAVFSISPVDVVVRHLITFGHSLICDPWGHVLAEQAAGNCVVAAEIDPQLPAQLRRRFPALSNRRLT